VTIDPLRREDLESELINAGCTIRGNTATCPRPEHEDKTPSASILCAADGHWRVFCHRCGGNALDAIDLAATAAGINSAEFLRRQGAGRITPPVVTERAEKRDQKPRRHWPTLEALAAEKAHFKGGAVAAVFRYEQPGRELPALVVVRITLPEIKPNGKHAKSFSQAHYDGQGWTDHPPEGMLPLYRLGEVIRAQAVVVVEGEQTADALRALGIIATTSAMGAGKADKTDWTPLQGKRVAVWPDHDETGADHARKVVDILSRLPVPPETVRVIDPTRLAVPMPAKGDAVEFLDLIVGDVEAKKAAVVAALRAAETAGPTAELLRLIDAEARGASVLINWPWPKLTDASSSLLPGSVTLLCGDPGSAKSWFVLASMLAWQTATVPCAMLALEEVKSWHLKRALAHMEGSTDLLNKGWVQANVEAARACALRHDAAIGRLGRAMWCESPATYERCAVWIEERCAAGARCLVIDPITLADPGNEKPWNADRGFMTRAKAAVERAGASLVLVTHPRKTSGQGRSAAAPMDDLAGGAVFQRAAASVLWLTSTPPGHHETVRNDTGELAMVQVHKVVRILKARNSDGVGTSLAFRFQRLAFHELGKIEKDQPAHQEHRHRSGGKHSTARPSGKRMEAAPAEAEDAFAAQDAGPVPSRPAIAPQPRAEHRSISATGDPWRDRAAGADHSEVLP
jgi:hypothetical protein